MIGHYWATGITLKWFSSNDWWASLDFKDEGHAIPGATSGRLATTYAMPIEQAIDTLIADAGTLGITIITGWNMPHLYVPGDGEGDVYLPANWRDIIAEQCERLGWHNPYKRREGK